MGISTVSMAWITPLSAATSAARPGTCEGLDPASRRERFGQGLELATGDGDIEQCVHGWFLGDEGQWRLCGAALAEHHFCLASHLSNCAISFFCATMICLARAFISGDLPVASSISAMFTAC